MDKTTLLEWYRQMVLIRRFEERSDELYQLEGKIKGFLHLYIGQEAVAVGTIAARDPERDHLITAYRDHGHALAVGLEAGAVMAELMGKATGVVGGRGGSMHLASKEKKFWGGYGIVGAHLTLGTGMALAEQYKGSGGVCLCYFGDGATNIGYFHESLNMAGVWGLPIVFICENNKYGMGTAVDRASANPNLADKAKAYNIPAKKIDGMNIVEVYKATQKAIDACRKGKGPQFLEMVTYRYEGHSIGDRTRYRPAGELDKWRDEKDPIATLQKVLLEEYEASEAELVAIDDVVMKEIDDAVTFANESPLPAPETLFDHIYPA
ncbi:MAG: pyruvate dehydrogenase (acetyl-transferring) E1 component subunit alpha [Chloroflexi bacterium]|nr:pyruvate dehydrogenase (acetyl-transferring) E1 component subunit alpha [Ardenticatenaceae bacterium]MBL1130499.1 pyruvate dehydrogenase (acetyl-transferring) E1 component subunit alpha [Chloroflexota bacterium]NOG36589.1 pyruvate dehydrogenase (acetyl-transferring) E1 component subunit alpha [Chloroflexota bacterium]